MGKRERKKITDPGPNSSVINFFLFERYHSLLCVIPVPPMWKTSRYQWTSSSSQILYRTSHEDIGEDLRTSNSFVIYTVHNHKFLHTIHLWFLHIYHDDLSYLQSTPSRHNSVQEQTGQTLLSREWDEVSECSRYDSTGRLLVDVITLVNDPRHVQLNKITSDTGRKKRHGLGVSSQGVTWWTVDTTRGSRSGSLPVWVDTYVPDGFGRGFKVLTRSTDTHSEYQEVNEY